MNMKDVIVLKSELHRTITEMKGEGTCGCSVENLKQLVRTSLLSSNPDGEFSEIASDVADSLNFDLWSQS